MPGRRPRAARPPEGHDGQDHGGDGQSGGQGVGGLHRFGLVEPGHEPDPGRLGQHPPADGTGVQQPAHRRDHPPAAHEREATPAQLQQGEHGEDGRRGAVLGVHADGGGVDGTGTKRCDAGDAHPPRDRGDGHRPGNRSFEGDTHGDPSERRDGALTRAIQLHIGRSAPVRRARRRPWARIVAMPANPLNVDDFGGELYNLAMSEGARPLLDQVKTFIATEVEPITAEYFRLGEDRADRWSYAPGQLELLDGVKAKAKANGLWNFFLPNAETGQGLSNLDYAYIAVELGKNPLASECLNCAAPDTGNMEVLERVGTAEQKKQWLEPLLNGEIRSAFAMTEPNMASSDARNISTTAVLDGDEWIINGEKYYISGAGDPRCKIMITMVRTSPNAPSHLQQSQILVPIDTPGVEILGPMRVFGRDDAPHGHMHIRFTDVRVPKDNILLGEGRGFEISQMRLGPGRIHHCMRSIGAAERALQLMVERGLSREAFGKPLIQLGKNTEIVSRARIEIEAMRMMVLKAAKAMDLMGNAEARVWVSAVKAMVPERVCQIIDQAIQLHGATGVSQWTPLADMYTSQRTLRLADGPDEVHHMVVGRAEIARYQRPAAT
jgi:acyl-CoA dehydrogenase